MRHTSYVSPACIFSCDCFMARTYASRSARGAKHAAAASPSFGSGSRAIDRARATASDARRGANVETVVRVDTDAHASTARSVSAIQNRAFSSASSAATRRTPSAAATAAEARPFRFSFVRNRSTYVSSSDRGSSTNAATYTSPDTWSATRKRSAKKNAASGVGERSFAETKKPHSARVSYPRKPTNPPRNSNGGDTGSYVSLFSFAFADDASWS